MGTIIHAVVVWGSNIEILENCLQSLSSQNLRISVTVINNNQLEVDRKFLELQTSRFVSFYWIENNSRQGFSENNNLAIRTLLAIPDYILLLNDDVILCESALISLIKCLERYEYIGVVGPQLLNPDLSLQWTKVPFVAGWLGLTQALFGNKLTTHLLSNKAAFWLVGACLLFKAKALLEVGLFDEGYGLGYGEDMDLLWRVLKSGWGVNYCDQARAIHLGGSSFGQYSYKRHRLIFHNLFRFMNKWLPFWQVILLKSSWIFGTTLRLVLTINRHKTYDKMDYSLALRAIFQEIRNNSYEMPTTL